MAVPPPPPENAFRLVYMKCHPGTFSGVPVQNKLVCHLGCLVLWQLVNKSVCSGLWYVPYLFQKQLTKVWSVLSKYTLPKQIAETSS